MLSWTWNRITYKSKSYTRRSHIYILWYLDKYNRVEQMVLGIWIKILCWTSFFSGLAIYFLHENLLGYWVEKITHNSKYIMKQLNTNFSLSESWCSNMFLSSSLAMHNINPLLGWSIAIKCPLEEPFSSNFSLEEQSVFWGKICSEQTSFIFRDFSSSWEHQDKFLC